MRRGFTLFEMVITIGVVAVAAAMVIPMAPGDATFRVTAAVNVIISDIELAQTMTMSHPDDPVFVKFDAENDQYWLAYMSAPSVPLTRADNGEQYLVQMGVGRAVSAEGVTMEALDMPGGILLFNAQGGVFDPTTTPSVIVKHGEESTTLVIATSTGTVVEQ